MGDFDLGLLDDDTYKVEVLRTKMLGVAEVFMYRLPSKSKSPYSAAGWPLTKPLQCCSLRLERRGTTLLLIFTYQQEGDKGKSKLFALCTIDVTTEGETVEQQVEAVTDSTRYFVIRVKDEKTEREARIGLGFREREESADFRAALQKYENDIAKEKTQRALDMASSHQK